MAGSAAFVLEQEFRDGPALALGANQIGLMHPDIVEKHLIDLMVAGQGHDRPHAHPRLFHIDQQEADAALGLYRTVGAHQAEHVVGKMRVRGPDLAPVDPIVLAALDRGGSKIRQIRARTGFRESLAPVVLTRENLGQVVCLLRRRSVVAQDRRQQLEAENGQPRGIRQGTLALKDVAFHGRPPGPAEFMRPVVCEPALLQENGLPLAGDLRFREHGRGGARPETQSLGQMGLQELPHHVAKFPVFGRDVEVEF